MATFTITAGLNEFIGGSANDIFIVGPSGDFGPVTIGLNDYNSYSSGAATLLIDTDITQTNVN